MDVNMNQWFNSLPCASPVIRQCDHCGLPVSSDDGTEKVRHFSIMCLVGSTAYDAVATFDLPATTEQVAGVRIPKPDASLNCVHHDPNVESILVIDLGEQCVVRVELGIYNDVWKLFCRSGHEHESTLMINEPFTAVRDAIDAADVPPVPRIELSGDEVNNYILHYRIIANDAKVSWKVLSRQELCAVAKLFGVEDGGALPIWTPTEGKWTQLIGDDYTPKMQELIPLRGLAPDETIGEVIPNLIKDLTNEFQTIMRDVPFKAYRYTRGATK